MDYLRTFNVTILACLLILSGCLGSTIDDTEAAEGDDSNSDGTTTVINNYYNNTTTTIEETPEYISQIGNGTSIDETLIVIVQDSGEAIHLLRADARADGYANGNSTQSASTIFIYSNCSNGMEWTSSFNSQIYVSGMWLPGAGLSCTHSFNPAFISDVGDNEVYGSWMSVLYQSVEAPILV
jgi:hypothetical protein